MPSSESVQRYGALVVLAFALPVLVGLLFRPAPYGRHGSPRAGASVSARTGWLIMEWPSVLAFAGLYLAGAHAFEPVPLCLFALWMVHYVQRTLVFPFLLRRDSARLPAIVIVSGMTFTLINGSTNALALSHGPARYTAAWLAEPRFLAGVALFFAGLVVNLQSDAILRNLRKPGERGYKIPHGGLYRWVTSPNYLGEIFEWIGFALAAGTLPALAFAVFTFANLAPRAVAHHRWYRAQFPDYPATRRALIPWLF